MTNTTATMTAAQAPVAHALATAFNHHWSYLTAEEVVGLTSAEIGAASIAREEPGIGCQNDAPLFDEDGDIVHTTNSGRLSWEVRRDGAVRLVVQRPAPGREPYSTTGMDVLTAYLPAEPYADGEAASGYCWLEEDQCFPRHLGAAHEAVQALVGLNPNADAVLAWLSEQEAHAVRAADWDLRERLNNLSTQTNRDVAIAISHLARRLIDTATEDAAHRQRQHDIRTQLRELSDELAALV